MNNLYLVLGIGLIAVLVMHLFTEKPTKNVFYQLPSRNEVVVPRWGGYFPHFGRSPRALHHRHHHRDRGFRYRPLNISYPTFMPHHGRFPGRKGPHPSPHPHAPKHGGHSGAGAAAKAAAAAAEANAARGAAAPPGWLPSPRNPGGHPGAGAAAGGGHHHMGRR